MLHVRPSKDLRTNYAKISELIKKGDRVIITVNGVGDGVFISMDDFNEYEALRVNRPVMTDRERRELTEILKECLRYSNSPEAEFFSHEEAGAMLGLDKA